MIYKFFITGTDTNIGKTYITVKLLKNFNKLGLRTMGIKPIATCGFIKEGKVVNEDALLLMKNSTICLDYDRINPFSFLPAVSPNIASSHLSISQIYEEITITMANQADVYIVEGTGGWHTPINDYETMADLACMLNIPVILVVGIKLGCLNHAILTYQNILSSKLPFCGWVANIIDPKMDGIQENIKTLKQYISAPCLGIIAYQNLY